MKMSGDIFPSVEFSTTIDVTKWNPLLCYLCNEKYQDPCILSCFHSYCSRCLRGRAVENKLSCPLCGGVTTLKDSETVPSSDHLMKFLVDQASQEDQEPCANCDQIPEEMFFCNTCSQPLCFTCRNETHKAKMFVSHDITNLAKRTKEIHRECSTHREPYILFSTEKKVMLCINCFRDMKMESRSHCVDLETAYTQGCKKLDQSMQAIRDLQNSVRDTIFLLKALLTEIQQSSQEEKKAITELYDLMKEKITEMKTELLDEVDKQYQEKETVFKTELSALSTLLPTLHTHLVTCAAFSSSANRYEFLDLAYDLSQYLVHLHICVEGLLQYLQFLDKMSYGHHFLSLWASSPLQIGNGSLGWRGKIFGFLMSKLCLEPLLFPSRASGNMSSINTSPSLSLTTTASTIQSCPLPLNASVTSVNSRQLCSGGFVQNGRRSFISQKMTFTDTKSVFAEHCGDFETTHKLFCRRIEKLKFKVQELQRDLTIRRCLTKTTTLSEMKEEIAALESELDTHYLHTEQKQPTLEKHWEDVIKRLATEQEIYKAQLTDVKRLKQESGHMKTILTQLGSFVKSITAVTERLAPKLTQSSKDNDHDGNIAALFEEINTMQPDSQHRVDAIRIAQEERETLTAGNRVNPLDKELIKTKGMLRAPSARREGVSRRNSTKRDSQEVKDNSVTSSPVKNPVNEDSIQQHVDVLSDPDNQSSINQNPSEKINLDTILTPVNNKEFNSDAGLTPTNCDHDDKSETNSCQSEKVKAEDHQNTESAKKQ